MQNFASAAARRLRYMLVAAVTTAAPFLGGAAAASLVEPDRNVVLRYGTSLDLQILDTRQRRRDFQDEQSRFREADRVPLVGQPRRPKVPRLQRNCQLQPFGSTFLRSCR
ncbi:MAG: hypothetical protein K0S21_940 [Rhizobiaceae bacterium]|jgi:hypothetical protein|nr:hypothetical protein [Rhizobiaceae bacterium]